MKEDLLRDINNEIDKLKIINSNFVGVDEQKDAFNLILKKLRGLYIKSPKLFNSEIVRNINDMKYSIDNSKSNMYPNYLIDRKNKLPIGTNGLLVMHKTQYYVGTINLLKKDNNRYCITLHNGSNKYAYESEIYVIGFYEKIGVERNVCLGTNEQSKITNINNNTSIEEEKNMGNLVDDCSSCKSRIDCVRRRHVNGVCDDYERGVSAIDYTQWDSHY